MDFCARVCVSSFYPDLSYQTFPQKSKSLLKLIIDFTGMLDSAREFPSLHATQTLSTSLESFTGFNNVQWVQSYERFIYFSSFLNIHKHSWYILNICSLSSYTMTALFHADPVTFNSSGTTMSCESKLLDICCLAALECYNNFCKNWNMLSENEF